MSDKVENIEMISGCFQSLSREDLEYINSKKTQISYLKGETLFKQEAFSPHVLFVNMGLVKVYIQTGKFKQINIRLAQKGDFMAFSSIFGETKYQYSAAVLMDSTICMIEKEALKKVLLRNTDFAMQITSKHFDYERRYLDIIKNVTYKQMRGKLASALLYLKSENFVNDSVMTYLSRQDIADFASITLESAVKFLKEFEAEGILRLNGKDIEIDSFEKLEILSLTS